MKDITWTCHVCHDERPDEKIDVFQTKVDLGFGIIADQNVRHCNDRVKCITEAPNITFFGDQENE
jgi:hypothetical protein